MVPFPLDDRNPSCARFLPGLASLPVSQSGRPDRLRLNLRANAILALGVSGSQTWRLPRLVPYAVVLLVVVVFRLPTLSNDVFSIDEVWNLVGITRLQSVEEFVYAFRF